MRRGRAGSRVQKAPGTQEGGAICMDAAWRAEPRPGKERPHLCPPRSGAPLQLGAHRPRHGLLTGSGAHACSALTGSWPGRNERKGAPRPPCYIPGASAPHSPSQLCRLTGSPGPPLPLLRAQGLPRLVRGTQPTTPATHGAAQQVLPLGVEPTLGVRAHSPPPHRAPRRGAAQNTRFPEEPPRLVASKLRASWYFLSTFRYWGGQRS